MGLRTIKRFSVTSKREVMVLAKSRLSACKFKDLSPLRPLDPKLQQACETEGSHTKSNSFRL